MFQLNNIIVSHEKVVLDVPFLEIKVGDKFLISGPSGAGKSTFLKLLNRFVSPTKGRILFEGKDLETFGLSYIRDKVKMVIQSNIVQNQSVGDYFDDAFRLRVNDIKVEESKILSMLDELNLRLKIGDNISNLSGGELQRLSIARAMLLEPKVLLLDEPTSALDSKNSVKLLDMMLKAKFTLIVVSHDDLWIDRFTNVKILKNGVFSE